MHIDHQIVFRAPDLFQQIEEAEGRAQSLTGLREIATGKEDHVRERGMMTDDLGILRCDQPVNSRTRITRPQFYQHRNCMHHIAKRRRFDQQNARELRSLQIR